MKKKNQLTLSLRTFESLKPINHSDSPIESLNHKKKLNL